ncbi:MAG: hypothetical protein KC466_16655 [Myxococcales bacterium]|nr:hypothetical protein [Myxococcales bacterium]
MASDRPTAAELVAAVREFLDTRAVPRLDGRDAFHARVAANVLAIVERELLQGPALDDAERRGLVRILGDHAHEGDLGLLNQELCRLIRSGALDERMDEVVAHVRERTLDKLAISNPKYPTHRKWRGLGG